MFTTPARRRNSREDKRKATMKAKVKAKAMPDGLRTVTPRIVVEGADKVIEFLKKVFDAKVTERLVRPDGKIGHAQVRIGDSTVMIGEAGGGGACGATPANLYVHVKDADATYKRALKAGGASVMEPMDMFWGDRYGAVKDRAGNTCGASPPMSRTYRPPS
jgi:uncharacterized glyoxalase superfamily protein PhnB